MNALPPPKSNPVLGWIGFFLCLSLIVSSLFFIPEFFRYQQREQSRNRVIRAKIEAEVYEIKSQAEARGIIIFRKTMANEMTTKKSTEEANDGKEKSTEF